MKLSDIKGEAAIDALADMLDPLSVIFSDEEFIKAARTNTPRIKLVKLLLKKHKKEVLEILAITEGEDPKIYNPNMLALPLKLLEIFNDETVTSLFISQVQTTSEESSTPATGNTGEKEK